MTVHLGGLGYEVARELTVNNPVDGVEEEDFAALECALQLVDELVVPWCSVFAAEFFLV